jgi:translation initiation factor 1 (eIF-1/SUI1)
VRDAVSTYITARSLVDAQNPKFVRLDASLTDALFGKKAPAGGYPERMARPDIFTTLVGKCSRYHRIKLFPGHDPKFHGGAIRPITIHAERSKRHNSSVITSIAFYQQFGVDGAAFAKEAQKKWGCAASVQPSEDKNKGEEIFVHGQMVNEVLSFLESKFQINTAKYCTTSYGKNIKPKKK